MGEPTMCLNCGKPIHYSATARRWLHDGVLLGGEWCGREMGSGGVTSTTDFSGQMAIPIKGETLAKLQKLAEESLAFVPHLTEQERGLTLHAAAEGRLNVLYNEADMWRINYTRPNGSVIGVNNRMPVELALAQIRGIAADFAESVRGVQQGIPVAREE